MHHPVHEDDLESALDRATALIRSAQRIAVLTGAGISAESGVPTFRGAGGLWEGQRIDEVATPFAFQRDPTMVWRFYNARRANLQSIRPNPGHDALVVLEKRMGRERFALITQNVDGLHRLAGSEHVLELHGNLRRVRCTQCSLLEDRGLEALDDLPHCGKCGQLLRPDIVWFHEMLPPDIWQAAEKAASKCDCFLVVGTSAVVYPAAGLIDVAQGSGARVVEVNVDRTEASHRVDIRLEGRAGEILPGLVGRIEN